MEGKKKKVTFDDIAKFTNFSKITAMTRFMLIQMSHLRYLPMGELKDFLTYVNSTYQTRTHSYRSWKQL